jgi:GNAT superfamily N-acetyltransferase
MQVVDIPADMSVRRTVARWCLDEWRHLFPDDTEQWYLDTYAAADSTGGQPPHALAVLDGDEVVGTALVVPDDGLPGAPEPGPWLAAVYVVPGHRGRGVGRALVETAVSRAACDLWLYTESETEWYAAMGWQPVRQAELNGHPVTVMSLRA